MMQGLLQSAWDEGVEPATSRSPGSCVCEPVQEPSGQVLAKIWTWLNQPIAGQIQVRVLCVK